jgi:hypothetical protein
LALAKQLNAIFQLTSAKDDSGSIDELFKNIGKKIVNPNIELSTNLTREQHKKKGEQLMKEKIRKENKKREGCC